MNKMEVRPTGTIACVEGEFSIVLSPEYAPALRGLDGHSHVQVVWWFDRVEDAGSLVERKPYLKGPDELGVFATRYRVQNPATIHQTDRCASPYARASAP